jgi:hypothetical protein
VCCPTLSQAPHITYTAAGARKQHKYSPLVEALTFYSDNGWVVNVFPWVVGIRGLIDPRHINALLKFLAIHRRLRYTDLQLQLQISAHCSTANDTNISDRKFSKLCLVHFLKIHSPGRAILACPNHCSPLCDIELIQFYLSKHGSSKIPFGLIFVLRCFRNSESKFLMISPPFREVDERS